MSFSGGLVNFFLSDIFYVNYATPIADVPEGILYIPALANIAPIAWALGADIYLDTIDQAFLKSLEEIKQRMRRLFPTFSFESDIIPKKIVKHDFGCVNSAQLFTGGLDSMATYIRHKAESPHLIAIANYLQFLNPKLQTIINREFSCFAQKGNLKLHTMESNLLMFVDSKRLASQFGSGPQASGVSEFWWIAVQFGLGMLGLCAPLTAIFRLGKLYIASSNTYSMITSPWQPLGSHRDIDNHVAWADTRAYHDIGELTRQEKIRYIIKPYVKETGSSLKFIVCNNRSRGEVLNCSHCGKCRRTIVGLALDGLDPRQHGFEVSQKTFLETMRMVQLTSGGGEGCLSSRATELDRNMWDDIQRAIPEELSHDIFGPRWFFEWLRALKD